MKPIGFLKEFFKSPRTVGAVAPSSQRLAEKMVCEIDFASAGCIVEYGPGTGVFTDMLMERKRPQTCLIAIESNQAFYNNLVSKYDGCDTISIIHGSAEHIDIYLRRHNIEEVDCIISGLPFASLPQNVSHSILEKTAAALKKEGLFITFQYTLIKKGLLSGYFEEIEAERVLQNFPPAYVLICQQKERLLGTDTGS